MHIEEFNSKTACNRFLRVKKYKNNATIDQK